MENKLQKNLLKNGATVIFTCRKKEKTLSVMKAISDKKNTIRNAHYIPLELSSFKSVENFVVEFSKKYDRLDMLVNNAGLFVDNLEITKDGMEKTLQTNHSSHFLLTGLLLKFLKKSDDPRVINVSSFGHAFANDSMDTPYTPENYAKFRVYGVTKAANILFAEDCKEFFDKRNDGLKMIKTTSLNPGNVRTEFERFKDRSLVTIIFLSVVSIFRNTACFHNLVSRILPFLIYQQI